jgi:hypothetical protein
VRKVGSELPAGARFCSGTPEVDDLRISLKSQQVDGDAATIMINMMMHSPGSGDQAHGANGILTAAINELIIEADAKTLPTRQPR